MIKVLGRFLHKDNASYNKLMHKGILKPYQGFQWFLNYVDKRR